MADDFDAVYRRLAALPVFFVGGLPRSGTTWLQQMLNAHPELVCMGESHYINDLVPKILEVIKGFNERRANSVGTWATTVEGFAVRHMRPVLQSAFASLVSANLDGRPADGLVAIGEKTPDNLMHLQRLWAIYPDARFVHIIRDPRDGAISGFARFRSKLPEDMTRERYVDEYSRTWKERILKARELAKDRRYLEIRYEAMHAAPEETTGALLRFLGASDAEASIRTALDAASFERLSGGRKRGQEDPDSHYRRGEVGGWRDVLNDGELAAADRNAGPLMAEFGYSRTQAGAG